jgi:hypothetical protein
MPVLEEQLVSELWARDVQFLMGRHSLSAVTQLTTPQLISSLAESADPRVRFSLIPLFLRHPEYSADVTAAEKGISTEAGQRTLRFYYTAAIFLQAKYVKRINQILGKQPRLPDLFSKKLGVLPHRNPDRALVELSKQHEISSGGYVNWLGTYEHAVDVWLRQMELQKA